ncbi:MAG: amidohydrolase, partial [Bacteroidetes bacterium]
LHPRKAVGHPNIFFDTLVHDTLSLELMIRRNKGTDQILVGLDDPYPLGEMESAFQSSYPGKLLDLAFNEGLITRAQQQQMWEDNVLRWLGADKNEALRKRITKQQTVS